jgi:hypothetical protein
MLVYTVRRNGVEVTLDGRTVIDWHGDPKRLSMNEGWKIPDPARLSLNTFKTVCRISKIEMAPLVENASSKPAAPPGLLKIFEDEPQFVSALAAGDGAIELVKDEKYSGRASIKVSGKQRFIEHLSGLDVKIRKRPTDSNEFRYLRFAWKKRGGEEILLQLHYPNNWLRYSAGPYQGNGFAESLRIAKELPVDFVEVTRDLAADFGEFTLTGLALTPVDGECGWFDHIYLARTLEDFDRIATQPTHAVAANGIRAGFMRATKPLAAMLLLANKSLNTKRFGLSPVRFNCWSSRERRYAPGESDYFSRHQPTSIYGRVCYA